MEYSKIDPGLAGALEDISPDDRELLTVSVRTICPLSPDQQKELRRMGGKGVDSGLGIYSATVDRTTLAELSRQPWVRKVSLARRLNMS